MCAQAIIAIIFIIFNCGPKVFLNDYKHKKAMRRLNKIKRIIKRQQQDDIIPLIDSANSNV